MTLSPIREFGVKALLWLPLRSCSMRPAMSWRVPITWSR